MISPFFIVDFPSGVEFERHLISAHFFDYCKLCDLIGPSATVRYHIGDLHKVRRILAIGGGFFFPADTQ